MLMAQVSPLAAYRECTWTYACDQARCRAITPLAHSDRLPPHMSATPPLSSRASTALMSPGRTRIALLALALGGFGIGTTEFVAMGLLPDLARDLLPEMWDADQDAAIGQTGWVITAYAMGVVAGAPTIAAAVARFP